MVNLGGSDRLMHCQLSVELGLFYQLTGSSDSVYLALELCVEMLHFPTGLTSHLFIQTA